MRFARFSAADGRELRGLDEFVATSRLDLLQLDYHRGRRLPADQSGDSLFPPYARGIERVVEALAGQLFLDPQLHVVTDAGWSDAYGCVESVAAQLVAKGGRDTLISAVRGSNLLPILDMLAAEGIDLGNTQTGAYWSDLRAPILAADLKLGSGPIRQAISEGGRVVIAGSYDGVSPVLALAIREWDWDWSDHRRLASAAAASQAVLAPRFAGCLRSGRIGVKIPTPKSLATLGELRQDGSATLWTGAPITSTETERVTNWLQNFGAPGLGRCRADVQGDFTQVTATVTAEGALDLEGGFGSASTGSWDLEVFYQVGYMAEALAVVGNGCTVTPDEIAAWLHGKLSPLEDAQASLSIRCLQESDAMGVWFHLEFRTPHCAACELFVAEARDAVASSQGLLRWVSRPPGVEVECGVWPASVPRDAIDLAVDTRPADQWQ